MYSVYEPNSCYCQPLCSTAISPRSNFIFNAFCGTNDYCIFQINSIVFWYKRSASTICCLMTQHPEQRRLCPAISSLRLGKRQPLALDAHWRARGNSAVYVPFNCPDTMPNLIFISWYRCVLPHHTQEIPWKIPLMMQIILSIRLIYLLWINAL